MPIPVWLRRHIQYGETDVRRAGHDFKVRVHQDDHDEQPGIPLDSDEAPLEPTGRTCHRPATDDEKDESVKQCACPLATVELPGLRGLIRQLETSF